MKTAAPPILRRFGFRRVLVVKLDALLGLSETAGCRRVRLLDYFGEPSTPCGNWFA